MPGFDGTGPRGLGPMTGRGEGYCAFVLPEPGTQGPAYGYAGLAGIPARLSRPLGMPVPSAFGMLRRAATFFRPRLGLWFRRWGGRGRGRGRWSRARRW
ncbi:MAG: DUF5320 domain-containing protein [Anaerolineae bacterium]|nr:DUF5320 domain-containing protein [Anaerolineae bacterium]